jgi:3-deoxy-D-arabino-heptulosonate 7-phosphate (DAHP) synthase
MLTTVISAIPTIKDGGNHTRAFAKSATTIEAHYACLDVSKALAATGMRVLTDEAFLARVSTKSFCAWRITVLILCCVLQVKKDFEQDSGLLN